MAQKRSLSWCGWRSVSKIRRACCFRDRPSLVRHFDLLSLGIFVPSLAGALRSTTWSLKSRSPVIFPKAFRAYTQMGGKADQFGFETLRSRRSEQKTDDKSETQNRDRSDNQARNERSKHESNSR